MLNLLMKACLNQSAKTSLTNIMSPIFEKDSSVSGQLGPACATATMRMSARKRNIWKRSVMSEQASWKRLLQSNFLSTKDLSSAKLFRISTVIKALSTELITTVSVATCRK